jgi:uncharacterized OsmC-like protein
MKMGRYGPDGQSEERRINMTTQTATKINGIDTDALRGSIEAISQDASRGICQFKVATNWTGGTRTESKVESWSIGGEEKPRGFSIRTDEPPELLGKGVAPNPQEVLMAGLNACMMVGYVAGCAVHGIELESLSIETEGELDLRGFLGLDANVKPGYDELRYVVRIKGKGTPEQFEQVHKTVMATSPNYFNISSPIRLVPQLVVE